MARDHDDRGRGVDGTFGVDDTVITERLRLEPLGPDDAGEMVDVLGDPALYEFIGGSPPTPGELASRFHAWAAGAPRPGEEWRNWIIRLGESGEALGHLQATIVDDRRAADIAWLVATGSQGRGYASEAAVALVRWLRDHGVRDITAHVHPDHAASGRVAAAAGLLPTGEVDDGEVVWRSPGTEARDA